MLSILILEDDAVSASLVARVFSMHGHKARTSARIADAWRLLRAETPDLLILDTDLGGEWGWEMLERVRRSVVYRELPVIVYSSIWRRDIVRRYMLLGVQGLLVKPYTPGRLMEEATRASESGWREPFFDFPELPETTGPGAERRQALADLLQDESSVLDLATRLVSNCVDIALQARMKTIGDRARKAGFVLLAEIAEKVMQSAIEVKVDRLPSLREDMEIAFNFLGRLLEGPSIVKASTGDVPTSLPIRAATAEAGAA